MSRIKYWLSGAFVRLWGNEAAIHELKSRRVGKDFCICSELRLAYGEADDARRRHHIEVAYLMAKKMHRRLRYYRMKEGGG